MTEKRKAEAELSDVQKLREALDGIDSELEDAKGHVGDVQTEVDNLYDTLEDLGERLAEAMVIHERLLAIERGQEAREAEDAEALMPISPREALRTIRELARTMPNVPAARAIMTTVSRGLRAVEPKADTEDESRIPNYTYADPHTGVGRGRR